MWSNMVFAVAAVLIADSLAIPPSCPDIPPARYPFELDKGWTAVKVAGGLTSPRGLVIDSAGRLLIVEDGVGISQHDVDVNGCITSSRMLVSMSALNHGIYLGIDSHTLYASSATTVYSWSYNPKSGNTDGAPRIVVWGMASDGHATRTLIIPHRHPDLLVVSHGSNSNLDYSAASPATARAIVKVFNLSTLPAAGHNYVRDGWTAGYGLRNEVGLAFDGNNMLWGVENSADQLTREVNGTLTDVHTDNPAEELNFLGEVSAPNDAWYGYPTCFTVWAPVSAITDTDGTHELEVGKQFVMAPNATFNDESCARMSVPPRLSFQAHAAPLDAKFDAPKYANLFVTLHGSWDRDPPTGYKLIAVPFTRDGGTHAPVAPATSRSGYIDVFYPPDEGKCSSSSCARPVGLAFDADGRLYMTSDTSGEVFMLGGEEGELGSI
ncbi:hypothetical protein GGR54DRAFT_443322 [Hypoxylon sp. NC1633]|nr:hypothetical protein GGR54DRAFT_443322 [Hypoxylon sp. NC1633]